MIETIGNVQKSEIKSRVLTIFAQRGVRNAVN